MMADQQYPLSQKKSWKGEVVNTKLDNFVIHKDAQ